MRSVFIRIICLALCVFVFAFYGCVGLDRPSYHEKNVVLHEHDIERGYQRPEFYTRYTEHEHIDRLHNLAVEKFAEKKKFDELVGKLYTAEYSVYTIYSFQNKPEYFLIQEKLIYNFEEFEGKEEFSRYWMGFIEFDEYYIIVDDFHFAEWGVFDESFMQNSRRSALAYRGENPYSINGVLDNKKFYGGFGQFAWIEKNVLMVLETRYAAPDDIGASFSDPAPFGLEVFDEDASSPMLRDCRFVYYDQRVLFDEI